MLWRQAAVDTAIVYSRVSFKTEGKKDYLKNMLVLKH